jgi:putative flippase GtrA
VRVRSVAVRTTPLAAGRALVDHRKVRFVMVSAVAVPFSQVVFVLCKEGFELNGTASNIIAVTLSCIPSYLLNRYWVWGKRGRNHFWREVFPFWAMAILGLILSTIFVWWVDQRTDVTLFLMGANLSAFGLLYVAKFLMLDRLLFKVADEMTHEVPPEHERQALPLA